MGFTEVKVTKAFKKSNFPSSMFGNMYSFSPYMGCSHGCTYCDGRAEKYHLEGDFENDIKVKTNIPDLLYENLPKVRENAPFHLSSGISDIYQAAENKYNLTGRCSEILSEHNFHVSVLTKSSLVLRDFDNWIKVNKKGGFTLQMSINTLDDSIRKIMEPGASSVDERLETVKIFKEAGCRVGIYMIPLLPGISDDFVEIKKTIDLLTDLGVDYIMPGTVTLRPGRQKDYYMDCISNNYREQTELYRELYRENRVSGVPIKDYTKSLYGGIAELLKDVNILPPHEYYRGTMPIYCEVIILLEHMLQLYSWKGLDVKRLGLAYNNLITHFTTEKKRFNRKRNLPSSEIDDRFKFLILTEGLNGIVQNIKLTNFIIDVVVNKKLLNYQTLKLY